MYTRLVFDIETAPLDEAAAFVEPATAPATYKDPASIAAYVAAAEAKAISKCALDPDLCRIVAIGWWAETEPEPVVLTADTDAEADMLDRFWQAAHGRQLVGFNCLGFDLPVLSRRSLYLGVEQPALQIDRYRHPQVDDLQLVLSFNGTFKLHGLSFYAARFGLEVPDALTGADIGQAVAEGRWDDIRQHCRADVQKTALVAARCGYFSRVTAGAF